MRARCRASIVSDTESERASLRRLLHRARFERYWHEGSDQLALCRLEHAQLANAYGPDGTNICVGSIGGEARIFNTTDKKRVATLKGHDGAIFAIAFHPATNQVVTGGFEGKLRVFETAKGELVRTFVPVPLKAGAMQQAAK